MANLIVTFSRVSGARHFNAPREYGVAEGHKVSVVEA